MLFTIRRPLTNEKVNLEITVKFHKPTSDIPLEAFRDVPYGPRSVGCCLAGPAAAWPLPERSRKGGRWSGEAARAAGGRVKKGRQLPHGSEGLGAGGHQPTRHLPVCSPVQGTASLLGEDEQRSVKGERFGENTSEEAPASHRRLPLGPRVAGESCSGAREGLAHRPEQPGATRTGRPASLSRPVRGCRPHQSLLGPEADAGARGTCSRKRVRF